MAKLKKFNNQTDYRTYIGSSEFSAPDVSAIGTSTVPADLDAEYNPLSMLHVNAKHSLAPTATTIPFIIDTITNGKVAIWWRPSTGSTYTKVNSTDLIFNSGFTENKITNLVINTKPASTDYNNIYVVSAVSDTSASINDTDTSTQYGLITLDGTTFNATGGSKTIQVKTAQGNKWQITDVPSWLTFSQITGSGPTSITVTAANYTSTTTDRSATVTIGYVDLDYTTTSGNFVQNKKVEDSYFEFSEHALSLPAEATPLTVVSYDASGSTIGKTIYFVSSDSSWLTVTPASTTATATGSINISTIANPNRTARTGTITARIGSSTGAIIDTINVSQQGAGGYFYVGSSVANAQSTSATTYAYPTTVGSADTASKTVYFATNYSASEVEALSVNYPTSISNVSVNTSNSSITFNFTERPIVTGATATTRNATITVGVATITATQAAPAYFKWDNSSITVGSSAGSTGSNTYSSNIAYGDITPSKSSTGTFITTGPTMNNTGVTFSVAANTTTEDKTCTITASLGSTTLDTFTVTQNGADAYFWTGSMNATAATTSVDSTGQTGCEVQCYSNRTSEYLNSITVSGNSSSWITNISWNSSTQKVSFNVNSYSGTDARSGIIGIYNSSGTMIGSINVNQGAAAPYFRFVPNNSTAYTYDTNTSAGTTFSVAIDTNYNLSDIKTAQATSTTEVSVTTYNNSDTDSRTGYIYFYTGATSSSGRIGVLTVTQNAAEYATITGGGTYESGTTSDTVYFETNWDSSSLNTLTLETSGGTWLTLDSFSTPLVDGTYYTYRLSSNSSTSQRTGFILLKSGNFVLDYVTINQNGQSIPTYYLYFTDYPSNNTITVTVDSADTSYSEAISYSYPSLSTGKTSNITSVSYDSNSVTANFDANPSTSTRTVGTVTLTGTGGAGAAITLTLEIKQNPKFVYITSIETIIDEDSVPDIHPSGGSVTCSDIEYTVYAYYSDGTSSDVTNYATIDCTGVTADTLCTNATTERTNVGTLEVSASYDGYSDTDTVTVYQGKNEYTVTEVTGTTTPVQHSETKTSETSYEIVCDPTTTGITSDGGTFDITVEASANTPTSAITYDTWQNITTYTSAYTSTCTSSNTVTDSAVQSGSTIVSGYVVTTTTPVSIYNKPNWVTASLSNNTCTVTVEPNTDTTARDEYIEFKATNDTSSIPNIASCSIEQDAATPSYEFYWENSSTTISVDVSSSSTRTTVIRYHSTYPNTTFGYDEIVTGVTDNGSGIVAHYTANPTTSERTGYVYAKSNGTTIGTMTITQGAQPKLFQWDDMSTPATTGLTTSVSYNSLTTSITKSYSVTGYSVSNVVLDTNNTGITMSTNGNSITVSIIGGLPSGSRSASVKVKENDTIIGEWTIAIDTNPTLEVINNSSVNIKVQGGTFAEVVTIYPSSSGYMYLSGLEELSSFDIDAEGNMIGVGEYDSNINVGTYPSYDIPIEVRNSAINSSITITN